MRVNDFKYAQEFANIPDGRILLVGMLEDGPVGRGFTLTEPNTARVLLGTNELTRAYEHLINTGVSTEKIVLYRLNGIVSTLTLEDENKQVYLELRSLTGHDDDNDISLTVSDDGITLYSNFKEEAIESYRRKDFRRVYLFEDYPDTLQLAEAITNDAGLGLHNIVAYSPFYAMSREIFIPGNQYELTRGSSEEALCIQNGNFPDDYTIDYSEKFHEHLLGFDYSGESNQPVVGIDVELMYFPDYPVDEDKSIAELAAMLAKQKTEEANVLCTALFRTTLVPLYRELEDGEYLTDGGMFYNVDTEEEELYLPNQEGEQFVHKLNTLFSPLDRNQDYMQHLQIVVGEDIVGQDEVYPASNYYASLYLQAEHLRPLTNKPLENFSRLRRKLSQTEVATISANGYICSVESIRRGFIPTKVQSMHRNSRLENNFYHYRILSFIKRDVFQILDKYIGLPSSYYFSDDVQTEIENYLELYVGVSALKNYTVRLRNTYDTTAEQEVFIDMVFYNELLKVSGQVLMNKEGWDVNLWTINQ